MNNCSPQMIEKMDSKWLPLATASIRGQAPSINILGFVLWLRGLEFDVSAADAVLIGRALTGMSSPDPQISRYACRALCSRSKDEWQRFDALFNTYWFPDSDRTTERSGHGDAEPFSPGGGGLAGIGTGVDVVKSYDADTVGIGAGAGRQATITKADFRFLDNRNAMRRVEELADHLLAAHSLDALRRYVRVMNV
jgi:uncharacterized protein with von Willebrand factor type A (vWA) domain